MNDKPCCDLFAERSVNSTTFGERYRFSRGVAATDHIWQKVLSGEYQAFSIGGAVYVSQEFDLGEVESSGRVRL